MRRFQKFLALLLSVIMVLSMATIAFAAEDHVHAYRLAEDSYEATETKGGIRHYVCADCGDEYSYKTDPTVYTVNPKTGEPVSLDGVTNPYLPNYELMPDNELHVFWSKEDSEWRVYTTGSHDSYTTGTWCGDEVISWSAPVYDLNDWRYEGVIKDGGWYFACDFAYDLLTDQAIFFSFPFFGNPAMGGTRLWTNGSSVPDAKFDTPLNADGITGIDNMGMMFAFDPAIYIQDDGTIYGIYDVQEDAENGVPKHAEIAKVNADRTAVEWTVSIRMAEGEHNTDGFNPNNYEANTLDYIEEYGVWVIQYSYTGTVAEGWYPLAYIYTSEEDLEHATWKWGGIIGDNSGIYRKDLETGKVTEHTDATYPWANNHGGLVEINGEWYLSNHRHTGGTNANRQSFLEKVNMTYKNGVLTIEPTEYTSSIGDSISAFETWPAYIACHLTPANFYQSKDKDGNDIPPTTYIDTLKGEDSPNNGFVYDNPDYALHRTPVVGIMDGVEVGFKYLDFGETAKNVALTVLVAQAEDYVNGTMDVYIDAPSVAEGGTKIGSVDITAPGIAAAGVAATGSDGTQWSELTAKMTQKVSGVHGVYFVFSSEAAGNICKLDEFGFAAVQVNIAFADLTEDSSCAEAVSNLTEAGIVKGTSNNIFNPDATVTTAEMVTFLGRIDGVEEGPTGTWYSSYMDWAKASGFVVDNDASAALTVEQANTILANYCAAKSINPVAVTGATRGDVIIAINAIYIAVTA